jgi:hypothetical protein
MKSNTFIHTLQGKYSELQLNIIFTLDFDFKLSIAMLEY